MNKKRTIKNIEEILPLSSTFQYQALESFLKISSEILNCVTYQ